LNIDHTRGIREMKKQLIGLGVAALVFGGVVSAGATYFLDQSNESVSSGSGNSFYGNYSQAQTFTAGMTGMLQAVDLSLFRSPWWEEQDPIPLTVEIQNVNENGIPDGNVLSNITLNTSAGNGYIYEMLRLEGLAAPVNFNEKYALVLSVSNPDLLQGFGWEITSGGDYYLGGSSFYSSGGSYISHGENDFVFRTYVEATPAPEPATMLLFGTGLVGLVGSRIRMKKQQ
jgi:PEP-CTERM motif